MIVWHRSVPAGQRQSISEQLYSIKGDNEIMSSRNGDKARYGRLRKKKIARRVVSRELRQAVLKTAPPAPAAV
jgi:hypothetical protein